MQAPVKIFPIQQTGQQNKRAFWQLQSGNQIALFFLFTTAGFLAAVMVGAALSWDGSYFLFSMLDSGQTFAPHSRFINSVAQYPALLASRFTNNMSLLIGLFGLGYAIFPIGALTASWFVVRKHSPSLFIWVALGTTFAILAGQFSLTTEALIVLHLAWPLAIMAVVPSRWFHIPLIIIFSVLVFISHPTAIALFAMVAVMAFIVGLRFPEQRLTKWLWAGSMVVFGGIALARFIATRTVYESDQLSLSKLEEAYTTSLAGVAIIAIALGLLAAVVLFAQPLFTRQRAIQFALYGIEFLCLAGAFGLMLLRASLPQLWIGTLDIRSWALFISLPFFAVLLLESIMYGKQRQLLREQEWAHRLNSVLLLGIGFFFAMLVQSMSWRQLTTSLQHEMSQNQFSCMSMTSLAWLERTPLNHWSVTTYSLLLQGQQPQSMVLGWENCASNDFSKGVQTVPWAVAGERTGGWFQLDQLQQRAVADKQPHDTCQFSFIKGWYWTENYGQSYWHWMGSQAELLVTTDHAQDVVLQANMLAVQQPNSIRIDVNGVNQASLNIKADRARNNAQRFHVQAGENRITLISNNAPVSVGADTRLLALGTENLSVTAAESNRACLLRP